MVILVYNPRLRQDDVASAKEVVMWIRVKKTIRNKQGKIIGFKVVEIERAKVTRAQARRIRAERRKR
jgi:hypothetical protein